MGVRAGVQDFALRGSGHLDLAGRAGSGGGTDGDDAPGGAGIYATLLFRNQKWVSCSRRRSQRCRRISDAQRCYSYLFAVFEVDTVGRKCKHSI